MIALVGLEKFKIDEFSSLSLETNPRLALDSNAKYLKGAGLIY